MDEKNRQICLFAKKLGLFPPVELKTRIKVRSSGEGSITKKGNTYYGRVTLGYDSNGKQIRKTVTAKTKRACIEKMQAVRNNQYVPPQNRVPTLIQWLNVWLNEYKKNSSVSTRTKYSGYFKAIETQPFAHTKINLIKSIELQQYINSLTSYEQAQRQINILKEVFALAQANGYVDKNIAVFLTNRIKPTVRKHEQDKAMTVGEEKEFIAAIQNNRYKILYYLCLYAGLRRGEACALTWEQIDMGQRTINVVNSVSRSEKKGYKLSNTKTINGIRTVPISDTLYNELSKNAKPSGFVYSNNGQFLNADILTSDFAEIMKSLGMKHNLHQLRHTFATRCHEKGIDVKVVQTWMGHASSDTTFNTYTHATKDAISASVKLLNW